MVFKTADGLVECTADLEFVSEEATLKSFTDDEGEMYQILRQKIRYLSSDGKERHTVTLFHDKEEAVEAVFLQKDHAVYIRTSSRSVERFDLKLRELCPFDGLKELQDLRNHDDPPQINQVKVSCIAEYEGEGGCFLLVGTDLAEVALFDVLGGNLIFRVRECDQELAFLCAENLSFLGTRSPTDLA